MLEQVSALALPLQAAGRDGARGGRRIRLSEVRGWHLAHLSVFPGQQDAFQNTLRACGGLEPPVELYRGIASGDARLYRVTDDQYWWLATTHAAMRRFAIELPSSVGTFTSLSASRVRIRITGAAARDVLCRGIAIDLHPAVFLQGHSAQTGLHHCGIFLERVADDGYEIFVPRSYAVSIWEWLIDAALPFGYDVGVGQTVRT